MITPHNAFAVMFMTFCFIAGGVGIVLLFFVGKSIGWGAPPLPPWKDEE